MKALEHMLEVLSNENGFGFVDASGNARFISRHNALLSTTILATFADGRSGPSYPGSIPFVDLTSDQSDIVNDYAGQREGGVAKTATNTASKTAYGPRSESISFLLADDNEVQSALDWKLSTTKDPRERIDAIVVKPGNTSAYWQIVTSLEVGSRVRVVTWPPGYTAPVAKEFLIRHLEARIPASMYESEFTFQLTDANADAWFILDDAVFGRLDYNKLAY